MKTRLEVYAALALVLVLTGVYLDRKYAAAGGATGMVTSAGAALFANVGNGIASLGGAALDALPVSQVTPLVDANVGVTPTASTLWYESLLMGGGN